MRDHFEYAPQALSVCKAPMFWQDKRMTLLLTIFRPRIINVTRIRPTHPDWHFSHTTLLLLTASEQCSALYKYTPIHTLTEAENYQGKSESNYPIYFPALAQEKSKLGQKLW